MSFATFSHLMQVAMGDVGNATPVYLSGSNSDLDSAGAEELWEAGGSKTLLAAAETMNIAGGAADDDGSTGVTEVNVIGLDDDYLEISEVVVMDGAPKIEDWEKAL